MISRTDSVGDMVLAMPVAAVLKKNFPDIKIGMMGRLYTKPVIDACKYIDAFINVDDFMKGAVSINGKPVECIVPLLDEKAEAKQAKKLKVPIRVGIANRWYHWVNCNVLVALSRSRSSLHEAQLNLKMLKPFGIKHEYSLKEIGELYGMENFKLLPDKFYSLIDPDKFNVILHPKSRGNGREWPLDNFVKLIETLDPSKYKIFISGVESERVQLDYILSKTTGQNNVTNISGQMNLDEFIIFIKTCDALVASGTGPVHVSAALGKDTIGLYPPIHPKHAGRWGPIGPKAEAVFVKKDCSDCKNDKENCHCMSEIYPSLIQALLDKMESQNKG